jgi:hypothetical protein
MNQSLNVLDLAISCMDKDTVAKLAKKHLRAQMVNRLRGGADAHSPEEGVGHVIEVLQRPMTKEQSAKFHQECVDAGVDCRHLVNGRPSFSLDTVGSILNAMEYTQQRRH